MGRDGYSAVTGQGAEDIQEIRGVYGIAKFIVKIGSSGNIQ
jgi:hypothetical protein